MKKYVLPLIIIVLLVLISSACNGQDPGIEPTYTPESTDMQVSTATNTPIPANSPLPTKAATQVPHPTAPAIPTATESEVPSAGTTRVAEIDQMVQVYVPAGEFIMGSDDVEAKISLEGGRAYPEIPLHTNYVDGFWIDKYEVTTSQYALCVDAGVCKSPYKTSSETRDSYYRNPEYANYPVIWVQWYMAKEYCEWAGRRLPTEAEWEKASRGTDRRKYPWGNDPVSGEKANFCDTNCPRTIANHNFDDGYADTSPVGNYPKGASPYGVMDMSGNVWEWTSTIIQPYPYDATDGREHPTVYAERVWRGGPWSNGYWWLRSSVRYRSIPSYWYVNLGFRCASSE